MKLNRDFETHGGSDTLSALHLFSNNQALLLLPQVPAMILKMKDNKSQPTKSMYIKSYFQTKRSMKLDSSIFSLKSETGRMPWYISWSLEIWLLCSVQWS